MSLVNDLIRRAREKPAELVINDNQVGTLADHCRSCLIDYSLNPDLEGKIRAGQLAFMGVPVRVAGQPRVIPITEAGTKSP